MTDDLQRPDTGEPPLDPGTLDGLRELSRGGRDVLGKLAGIYARNARTMLDELRSAADADDAERVMRAAHTLKGSSANIGALRLAGLCKDVEAIGRRGTVVGVIAALRALESEYRRVQEALSALRPQPAEEPP
jgi:two-component system, sensor histidine kinase and response regulator